MQKLRFYKFKKPLQSRKEIILLFFLHFFVIVLFIIISLIFRAVIINPFFSPFFRGYLLFYDISSLFPRDYLRILHETNRATFFSPFVMYFHKRNCSIFSCFYFFYNLFLYFFVINRSIHPFSLFFRDINIYFL